MAKAVKRNKDMIDLSTPIDTSFERWVELSDAYEQSLSHMKHGDEGAREEAIRLARALNQLTQAMGTASARDQRLGMG